MNAILACFDGSTFYREVLHSFEDRADASATHSDTLICATNAFIFVLCLNKIYTCIYLKIRLECQISVLDPFNTPNSLITL